MSVLLVLAKAPVPGQAKTRLCPPLDPYAAAEVAAAALLDTIDAVAATAGVRPVLAYTGDFARARRAAEIHTALAGWHLVPQRGSGLAERIVNAHAHVATTWPGEPVVQIGMDTPQIRPVELTAALDTIAAGADGVLGPAADGGWWALGLRDPLAAEALRSVPTSTARTGERSRAALTERGLRIVDLPVRRDVDTWADAVRVGRQAPYGRFAAAVAVRASGLSRGGPAVVEAAR